MRSAQPNTAYLPVQVLTRDGGTAVFDADKIRSAIQRAGAASGEFGEAEAQHLRYQVVNWLNHVYPPEIGAAHREGDVHIHDLDMLAGYCAGWSLRTLLTEGLNGVPGKVEARPPRHLSSAVGQIVNFPRLCPYQRRSRSRSGASCPSPPWTSPAMITYRGSRRGLQLARRQRGR